MKKIIICLLCLLGCKTNTKAQVNVLLGTNTMFPGVSVTFGYTTNIFNNFDFGFGTDACVNRNQIIYPGIFRTEIGYKINNKNNFFIEPSVGISHIEITKDTHDGWYPQLTYTKPYYSLMIGSLISSNLHTYLVLFISNSYTTYGGIGIKTEFK